MGVLVFSSSRFIQPGGNQKVAKHTCLRLASISMSPPVRAFSAQKSVLLLGANETFAIAGAQKKDSRQILKIHAHLTVNYFNHCLLTQILLPDLPVRLNQDLFGHQTKQRHLCQLRLISRTHFQSGRQWYF